MSNQTTPQHNPESVRLSSTSGRRFGPVWNWLLLIVGVGVASASVGQYVLCRQRADQEPLQQVLQLAGAVGGTVMTITGFTLIAASMPEDLTDMESHPSDSITSPQELCQRCETLNRENALYCDHCGQKLV